MISNPDRREAVTLIEEAAKTGARLFRACAERGICQRTYRRGTAPAGTVKADGHPEAARAPTRQRPERGRTSEADPPFLPTRVCPPTAVSNRTSPGGSRRVRHQRTERLSGTQSPRPSTSPGSRCGPLSERTKAPLGHRAEPGRGWGHHWVAGGRCSARTSISPGCLTCSRARSWVGKSMKKRTPSMRPGSSARPVWPKGVALRRWGCIRTTAA